MSDSSARPSQPAAAAPAPHRAGSDVPFYVVMGSLGGSYVVLILALLAANLIYIFKGQEKQFDEANQRPAEAVATDGRPPPTSGIGHFIRALGKDEIRYAIRLTLITCTISALLSIWVATPLGYLLSRFKFRGRGLIDTIIDIPIVLPPLVIGLSLLILFHLPIAGISLEDRLQRYLGVRVTYAQPAVVLAQFSVACAFAVQTMRVTFDQIDTRAEQVALTLGATRARAFFEIALPQAWRGIITAVTVAWARSLGEFGPILVFAGATRKRTEVLSTTVFLELSVGQLEAAVAVSLLMVLAAMVVLGIVRMVGPKVIR
jgi:molybdate transport system permease protein